MLTEDTCLKKYMGLKPIPESIETVALWIQHHKEQYTTITTTWLTCFRTASEQQRLTLLYVVNHVCQTGKSQKYDQLKQAFAIRLSEAMSLVRHDEGIIDKVKRIIDIWEERRVFKQQDLAHFKTSLSMTFDNDGETDVDEELLLDFEPMNMLEKLEKYSKSEILIEKARELLPQAKFDFEGKLKNCLKDRQGGERILHEIDEAYQKMRQFVVALEEQLNQHHRLIALMEQARSYYGQTLKDATTVEDAYQKFVQGIRKVKEQLEDMQQTGVYLGASPPRDAPSPQPSEDPFQMGVEAAMEDLKRPGNRDMFEQSDMDIDEVTIDGDLKFRANQSFLQESGASRIRVDPRIERFAKSQDALAVRPNLYEQPPPTHQGQLPPPPRPPYVPPWNGGARVPPPATQATSPPMYNPAQAPPYGLPPPNFSMPPPGMGGPPPGPGFQPHRGPPPGPISPGYHPPPNAISPTGHYPPPGMSPPGMLHAHGLHPHNNVSPPAQRSVSDVISHVFHGSNSDDEEDENYGNSMTAYSMTQNRNNSRGSNTSNLTVLSRNLQ